jgi:hypothetical protein
MGVPQNKLFGVITFLQQNHVKTDFAKALTVW